MEREILTLAIGALLMVILALWALRRKEKP